MHITDQYASASFKNMIAHVSGPLRAGAVYRDVPVDAAGKVSVGFTSREPLLLAAVRLPLDQDGLRLEAILDPQGGKAPLLPLLFGAYAESGVALPLYLPVVDPQTRTAQGFELQLALVSIPAGQAEHALDPAEISGKIELYLVEGIMGRMIYLLGAEKSALRRQAREIAAMRLLKTARDNALDRLGADLSVPRLLDDLVYRQDNGKDAVVLKPAREADADYRTRLALYKQFQIASPAGLNELLNGPGEANQPNAGLLSRLGFSSRFRIVEEDNEFAIAIHLLESGVGQLRDNFLAYLRRVHLLLPANNPVNNKVHAARFLPQTVKERIKALRGGLRGAYEFANAEIALAPVLAETLDRLGRCRSALGDQSLWRVLRAQDAGAGSRYELGLGCDIELPDPGLLDTLAKVVQDPQRHPVDDAEVEALLRGMKPKSAADDPEGRWLLEPCGLRTVHRLDNQTVYLSHFPTFGLVVSGGARVNPGSALALEARYHAPGDPGANVVLVQALADAASVWAAAGKQPWTAISDAQALQVFERAAGTNIPTAALTIFPAAGLPGLDEQARAAERLRLLPGELYQVVIVDAGLGTAILSPQPGADLSAVSADLRLLVRTFQEHGVVSILPLVSGPKELALVLGAIGLPEAGINLADRRASGFYWYRIPLVGPGGQVRAVGSRTEYTSEQDGLDAIVVVGYARRGLSDPYEYRIELPDGALLNLRQYEFLMNLLERAYPLGIEINTFRIRGENVDLNGDGRAEPLLPSVARTYRPFVRRRLRGEVGREKRSSDNGNIN